MQGRGVCVHLAADDRNAAVAQPPFAHKRGDAAGYGLALGVNTCGRRDKKARVLRRFRRAESQALVDRRKARGVLVAKILLHHMRRGDLHALLACNAP